MHPQATVAVGRFLDCSPHRTLPEIKPPIRQGSRWNTLYEQVRANRWLDRETLEFQARHLCNPPLEEDKVNDLINILEKRREARGDATDNEADVRLDAYVGSILIDRLRGRWIYLLPDEQ